MMGVVTDAPILPAVLRLNCLQKQTQLKNPIKTIYNNVLQLISHYFPQTSL